MVFHWQGHGLHIRLLHIIHVNSSNLSTFLSSFESFLSAFISILAPPCPSAYLCNSTMATTFIASISHWVSHLFFEIFSALSIFLDLSALPQCKALIESWYWYFQTNGTQSRPFLNGVLLDGKSNSAKDIPKVSYFDYHLFPPDLSECTIRAMFLLIFPSGVVLWSQDDPPKTKQNKFWTSLWL